MEYHQITLSEWMDMKEQLRRELNNVRQSYIRVGYVLRKMDETRAYEAEGYKSIAEFARKEHGLLPSTTSRWIAINKEYSLDGYSMQLDPKYVDMNASQLAEMLALPEKDRELVTPETSREEIRELKRFNREELKAEKPGECINSRSDAFLEFLEKEPEAAERVRKCLAGGHADAEHLAEAVAPSGSRMFRAGTRFVTFQKTDIKIRVFGGDQETVSWQEFAVAAAEWMERNADEGTELQATAEDRQETTGEEAPERGGEERPDSPGMADGGRETDGETEDGEEWEEDDKAEIPETGDPEGGETEDPEEAAVHEVSDDLTEPAEIGMNPPVAPAQFSEEICEEIDEERTESEDDKYEKGRMERVRNVREDANRLIAEIEMDIDRCWWPEAEEKTEKLLRELHYLRKHDEETAMKRGRQIGIS